MFVSQGKKATSYDRFDVVICYMLRSIVSTILPCTRNKVAFLAYLKSRSLPDRKLGPQNQVPQCHSSTQPYMLTRSRN